jgi:hypothetical protein
MAVLSTTEYGWVYIQHTISIECSTSYRQALLARVYFSLPSDLHAVGASAALTLNQTRALHGLSNFTRSQDHYLAPLGNLPAGCGAQCYYRASKFRPPNREARRRFWGTSSSGTSSASTSSGGHYLMCEGGGEEVDHRLSSSSASTSSVSQQSQSAKDNGGRSGGAGICLPRAGAQHDETQQWAMYVRLERAVSHGASVYATMR